MATGFPVKANYATGDVLTAANMNDLAGTLNYLDPTAKGDLFPASDGSTLTRLAVGTNGQVLTADSTQTTGIKWATASSGSLVFIKSQSFSNVVNVDIDSAFSTSYTNYLIIVNNFYAATSTDDMHIQMRYGSNTDTTANYYCSGAYNYTTLTGYSNVATDKWVTSLNCGSSTQPMQLQMTLMNIGTTIKPSIVGMGFEIQNSTYFTFGGGLNASQSYTGMRLKSSSSNITGEVKIYGIANS